MVALALRVVMPPGFMIADRAGASGFPLVICTGQGPATLADLGDKPAPPAKSRLDAPCAFAGGVASLAPSLVAFARLDRWDRALDLVVGLRDQVPGRGLAAPPPPAVGPPLLI
jgi:hypothetical protein